MTNTYSTGNPLGSTDPRDLYDNASNFDDGMNSASPAFTDRLGAMRKSWNGMETEFSLSQSGREAEFQQFLTDSGFVSLGNYAAGLNFTAYNQYMARDGFFYRPAPSSIPFTTTGTWVGGDEDLFSLFSADDVLRQDLADATDPTKGAGMVGRATVTVDSVADLALVPRDRELGVFVSAYRAGEAHGGGLFNWVETSTEAADGGVVFDVPGVATGRWVRVLVDGSVHTDHYGPVKDGVTVDAPAILAAKSYAEQNFIPCVLDAGDYAMGGTGLDFDLPLIFRGASRSKTRLLFSSDLTGHAIGIGKNAYVEQLEIGGFQCVGSMTGTGLSMGKDLAVNAVDCVVSDMKFFEFAVGHSTQFTWDCSFRNLRFQNCAKSFAFGSQSNTCTFETCQYVSFTQVGTFINCEGLLFLSPDISNFSTTNGFQMNQSIVRMVNPYVEFPGTLLGQVGGANDVVPSALHISGGMMNPCGITYAKNAVVVVDDVRVQFGVGKVTLGSIDGSPGAAPHRIKLNTYGNDDSRKNTITPLFYADNSAIVGFSNAFGGGSITYQLQRDFIRITQSSENNGMYIAGNLVAGKQYTLVAAVRRESGIHIDALAQGYFGAAIPLDSVPESTSDFKRVHFVFTAAGAQLRWLFQGSIQLKLLALYEGVVEDSPELPVVRRWQGSAPPSAGAWARGDVVENNSPVAGQASGWICTTAGTPGTWTAMANIAA